jgi:hypothetical protein
MRTLPTLALAFALAGGAPAGEEKGFVPLFDGKSLSGWFKAGGGATYTVEGGCIVGAVGPGPNTFLCTKKDYANFVLKLDVKMDVPVNSGIQVRSHHTAKGRVYGYQCEVDPSKRAWSGGIYDEGRRGWLQDLKGKDRARKAFKPGGWNHFVIRAEGPRIRTWVNDVPCADLLDPADRTGFIGLQVHAAKKGKVRFKEIRIKELPASKWQALLGGKSLAGWKKLGGGEWKVEGGVLRGTSSKAEPRHGILLTKKSYGDFAVTLKFRAVQGNSGLYFRVEEAPKEAVMVKGFQAEIDPTNDVGGLYETLGRGWVVRPKPAEVKKWFRPGAWNELSVIALGGRVVVHVNGKKSAELKDDPGRRRGPLGLQLHGGQDMDVRFKDIEVLELPAG